MHENGSGIHNLCVVGVGGRGGAVGNYCNCEQLGFNVNQFFFGRRLSLDSVVSAPTADRRPPSASPVPRVRSRAYLVLLR